MIKEFLAVLISVTISPSLSASLKPPPPAPKLPNGFVYITDVIPDAILDIRYYSENNFIGARIDGYNAPKAIATKEAANALKLAADDLRKQGYVIKIFDAYRPQTAVNHFIRWAQDENDTIMKAEYYPDVDKSKVFELGYIAKKSGHSRGSTIDLTLVDIKTNKPLDMGTDFDFFGKKSSHGSPLVTKEQAQNRLILKTAMEKAGFMAYSNEWWHYILINEPYTDTYFDFLIE